MHTSTTLLSLLALAAGASAKAVWATPHDSYSSSIGVLGCKINTNRVAYWPGSVDCNNLCIKLTHGARSVHLLRIDQSGGAFDISYDAWAYLQTGQTAAANPIAGGTVAMDYEEVPASECAGLIHTKGSKLPLTAANSMNFLVSCLAQPDSWVAQNHVLYNICDPICSLGFDEECSLDLAVSNQPSCPHTLGLTSKLTTAPVYNIEYQTGKTKLAGTGEIVSPDAAVFVEGDGGSAGTPPPASSSAPAPAPAPVAATAGIFVEVSGTPAAIVQSTTSAARETTVVPPASSTQSTVVVESSRSTTLVFSTTTTSETTTSQYTLSPSADRPGTNSSTTLSSVTVSRSPSTTRSTTSSTPSTVRPSGAGHAAGGVPVLVLFSSMLICSILSAL